MTDNASMMVWPTGGYGLRPVSYWGSQQGDPSQTASIAPGAGQNVRIIRSRDDDDRDRINNFGFPILNQPIGFQHQGQAGLQRQVNWTVPSGCNQQMQPLPPVRYSTVQLSTDLTTDPGRINFMNAFAQNNGKVWTTNRLAEFIDQKDLKAEVRNDGRVVLEGLKLNIPDMYTTYRDDLKREVDNLYRINCKDKENVASWMKVVIVILGIAVVIMAIVSFIYFVSKINTSSD